MGQRRSCCWCCCPRCEGNRLRRRAMTTSASPWRPTSRSRGRSRLRPSRSRVRARRPQDGSGRTFETQMRSICRGQKFEEIFILKLRMMLQRKFPPKFTLPLFKQSDWQLKNFQPIRMLKTNMNFSLLDRTFVRPFSLPFVD